MNELDLSTLGGDLAWIAIGAVAGWWARDVWKAAQEVHRMSRRRNARGMISGRMVALGVAVLFTAAAAVITGVNSERTESAADRAQRTADCTENVLGETVEALNARTEFTARSARVQAEVLHAQVQLFEQAWAPQSTEAEEDTALRDYFEAIRSADQLLRETEQARDKHPFPTRADIAQCLRKD
jgi:hypothetical protein